MEHAPYLLAERLERELGDPTLPETVFGYAASLALDEREEFPSAACARLEELGVHEYYVPAEHGGRLESYEQLLQMIRAVARRDLTVAIGHGKTYLGGVCVWVAGTDGQAAGLGRAIRAGLPVSLGLTERDHGSDLLAGEVRGEPDGAGGYLVHGEKWLINNATRGSLLSLLTRTDPAGGPRAFSVLLVDKRELPAGTFRHVDKIHTLGIRGADISGIAFAAAPVPADAVVGTVGGGLEIVLKALQLTRTMCAALSLGAADHALALGLDFAQERELYGRPLVALPQARRGLAESAVDVLTGEALALVASRAVHTNPEELSVSAAVTKYLVPTSTDGVVIQLTRLLGARAFLKGVYAGGRFQKIERDHRLVGLFDGNTLVNLNSLISQFRSLARGYRKGSADPAAPVPAYRLGEQLPALQPKRLSLVAKRGSSVIASLPESVRVLREAAESEPGLKPALSLADQFLPLLDQVHAEMERYQDAVGDVPPEAFEVAKRYCLLFAAASCLGLWVHTHADAESGATAPLWHDALWLRASLSRLLVRLGGGASGTASVDAEAYDEVLEQALALRADGRLVSLLPFVLRDRAAATPTTPADPPTARAGGEHQPESAAADLDTVRAPAAHPTSSGPASAGQPGSVHILVEEAS